MLRLAVQPQADDPVQDGGDRGHADHGTALDGLGCPQALDRLPENGQGDDHQGDGVNEGGQDADPVVTVRPPGVGRASGLPDGKPGEDQREGVSEVVARVGQQRQTVREVPRDRLAEYEGKREADRQSHPEAEGCSGVRVGV
jgi:hypothetical protein